MRFRVVAFWVGEGQEITFNTSKVRFREIVQRGPGDYLVAFNTSKVRFRVRQRVRSSVDTSNFQYLKGAIQRTRVP